MNLKREFIDHIFVSNPDFIAIEAIEGSENPKVDVQEVAYNMFIYDFLNIRASKLGSYSEDRDDVENIETVIAEINEFLNGIGSDKIILETKEETKGFMIMMAFNAEDKDQLEELLNCSALKYEINRDYDVLLGELSDIVSEYEGDQLLRKDPYKYYGVNPKDFY